MKRAAALLLLCALVAGAHAVTIAKDEKGRVVAILSEDEMAAIVEVHNAQVELIRALEAEVLRLRKAGNCS